MNKITEVLLLAFALFAQILCDWVPYSQTINIAYYSRPAIPVPSTILYPEVAITSSSPKIILSSAIYQLNTKLKE